MTATAEAGLLDAATFVEVARTGSFRAAARLLGVPTSTVSRRIARLEKALGTRLFLRSSRQVRPTGAAQRYLERVAPALAQIRSASEEAGDHDGPLAGPIRVTAPPDMGHGILGQLIAEFSAKNPGVSFDVDVSARVVDLVGEGFDLAFRASRLDASASLVARKLVDLSMWVVATPAWAEPRKKALKHPQDLEAQRSVLFRPTGDVQRLVLERGGETIEVLLRGPVSTGDFWFARTCILAGLGAGVLPSLVAAPGVASGELVRLFPEWATPAGPVHVVHAQGRYLTARARAFRDFVVESMKG